jgi:hypothetical protein
MQTWEKEFPGADVTLQESGESTTTDEYGTFTYTKVEEGGTQL